MEYKRKRNQETILSKEKYFFVAISEINGMGA
jgi:hypothetical protein